jgi:hypothetical protein
LSLSPIAGILKKHFSQFFDYVLDSPRPIGPSGFVHLAARRGVHITFGGLD